MPRLALLLVQAALLAIAAYLGLAARDPALAGVWPWPLIAALPAALALLAIGILSWPRSGTWPRAGSALAGLAALLLAVSAEARFQFDRWRVHRAASDELAALGRHLIVGYRSIEEVLPLVERGAIGGVFLSAHNVAHRDAAAVRREIAGLQAVQRRHGRPPLWVAADQEGGLVSRLSPPLPREPSLGTFAALPVERRWSAVEGYARRQGTGLAALGVNLNFSPVVDLDFAMVDPADRHTRISARAIGADPVAVAEIAGRYCAGLAAAGVRCSLKHFPGLGRVRGDTHVAGADLAADAATLAAADWVPFRRLAAGPAGPVAMLAHVRLVHRDAERPVSISRAVVGGLLRTGGAHDGLLVTDDLCMGAIYHAAPGLRAAAVEALNAGVDLLLVSWDGTQIYKVLSALLVALRDGRLDRTRLASGRSRLEAGQPVDLSR